MVSTKHYGFCKICCGFHNFCCGIRKFACFWSIFEQYSVLAICPWNLKQQRSRGKLQKSGFRDKSDFGLLRNSLTVHKCRVWKGNKIFAYCSFPILFRQPGQFFLVRSFLVTFGVLPTLCSSSASSSSSRALQRQSHDFILPDETEELGLKCLQFRFVTKKV